MNLEARSRTRLPGAMAGANPALVRRGSFAVLVLLIIEFGIGMYVNLYDNVPKADHGGSIGTAISNGPATISLHVVVGLLLGLGALGVVVASIMARHLVAIILSAIGLLAMILAMVAGTSFTSSPGASESMAMSVFTGVAALCYAGNVYFLRAGRSG